MDVLVFGVLRQHAGADRLTAPDSIGSIVDLESWLEQQGTDAWRADLASSRIWVNGTSADTSQSLGPGDEIAVLPPFAGG